MTERRVIRGATALPLDGRRSLRTGDLLLEQGTISAMGGVDPRGAIVSEFTGLVMPAFVQAHLHIDESLFGAGFVPHPDAWRYRLADVPAHLASLSPIDRRQIAIEGLARSILCGVGTVADGAALGLEAIDAAEALGVRLVATVDAVRHDVEATLAVVEPLLSERSIADRVTIALWCGDAERTPAARLRAAAQIARQRKLPLIVQVGALPESRGGLGRLEKAGALCREAVLCHASGGTLASPDARRRVAQSGASVVVTPSHDILVGAATAPVAALLDAGINVALGTDSAATRTDLDPLAEVRLLYRSIVEAVDEPAATALEIACAGGGRALGMPVGTVEVGRHADLALVDVPAEALEDHEEAARFVIERGGPDRLKALWIHGRIAANSGRTVQADPPSRSWVMDTTESMQSRAAAQSVAWWLRRAGARWAKLSA